MENGATINIKAMSVNQAWKGRRFKTPEYNNYHLAVTLLLPKKIIVPEGLLRVYYEFGMSAASDLDNPVKAFTDIISQKYGFNDNRIMEAVIKKVVVPKGKEYIKFHIESLTDEKV
jgi:Holliday junction resolvase RusA-like endonuclease